MSAAARRRIAVFLLAVPLAGQALAWNAAGHAMAAQIAYERLTPPVRQRVDALLAVPVEPADLAAATTDFAGAARWADDVRHREGFEASADEHYIDYPFSADATPLPGHLPKAANIVAALRRHADTLASPAASETQKGTALRFLVHFAADIHQPLHCATRVSAALPEGDRGGNDFRIVVRDPASGEKMKVKLHAYWDGGADSLPKGATSDEIRRQAAAVAAAYAADAATVGQAGAFDFAAWAEESRRLAAEFVYAGLTEDGEPPAGYRAAAQAVARQRIAWAGYRLATLLNALLDR